MERNKFILDEIRRLENRFEYLYRVEGEWCKYFNLNELFSAAYEIDVSSVRDSVAVVPLLGSVLPLAWLCDAEIAVPCCDKDFFDSVPEFKKGFINMYPMMDFRGVLTAETLEQHSSSGTGAASFFSGGVDSTFTMIEHRDEHPLLVTLWGSDITVEDLDGWNRVSGELKRISVEYGMEHITIKTGFRRFLNETAINEFVKKSGDGWWHGFLHGLGIITHMAPIAYTRNISVVYMPASLDANAVTSMTIASYPTIDNFVRFCGSRVIHDGFEYNRQSKIRKLCEYCVREKKKLHLRVCWEKSGGGNCCVCEKCARTMLCILSEGEDPNGYGFQWNARIKRRVRLELTRRADLSKREFHYTPIIFRMKERFSSEQQKEWMWLFNLDFKHVSLYRRIRKSGFWQLLRRVKHALKGAS